MSRHACCLQPRWPPPPRSQNVTRFLLLLRLPPPTRIIWTSLVVFLFFIVELELIKLNHTNMIKGLILLEMGITNPEFRFVYGVLSLFLKGTCTYCWAILCIAATCHTAASRRRAFIGWRCWLFRQNGACVSIPLG